MGMGVTTTTTTTSAGAVAGGAGGGANHTAGDLEAFDVYDERDESQDSGHGGASTLGPVLEESLLLVLCALGVMHRCVTDGICVWFCNHFCVVLAPIYLHLASYVQSTPHLTYSL